MKRLIVLAALGLAMAGCNCSPTEPKYRCSSFGIVEVQEPWGWSWKPVSGSAIVRCTPGQAINSENLK